MAIDIYKLAVACPLCESKLNLRKVRENDGYCDKCGRSLNGKYSLKVMLNIIDAIANTVDDTLPEQAVKTKEAQFEEELARVRKCLCPECGKWLSDTLRVGKNALVAHCGHCGTEVASV